MPLPCSVKAQSNKELQSSTEYIDDFEKKSFVICDTECETQSQLFDDMEPHSQRWDCDQKDYFEHEDTKESRNDAPKKRNVEDASTQTPEYNKVIDGNIIKSNESFGVFVAQELLNVPLIKRRQIMFEIVRLFEHRSQ
ncbi:unnamed protein product [Euphydryas editha]|uniref:BESS domain-containing protein n=1 Tax=Euphydryas editha TaxID=104508 RepID=A0AAU9TS27_EUPED|nr:unnamed protein product [Euphydryas editha]